MGRGRRSQLGQGGGHLSAVAFVVQALARRAEDDETLGQQPGAVEGDQGGQDLAAAQVPRGAEEQQRQGLAAGGGGPQPRALRTHSGAASGRRA